MNKTAVKTRKKLEKALLKLLQRTPLDLIRISDICAEAGVSRTAFYHHFTRPDDILLSSYEAAHEDAFGKREWTLEYCQSDQFIRDMIGFFDRNSQLIREIGHWDLLGSVTSLPTAKTFFSASSFRDPGIAAHPEYSVIFLWGRYFSVCLAWLYHDKKETPEELFQLLRSLRDL